MNHRVDIARTGCRGINNITYMVKSCNRPWCRPISTSPWLHETPLGFILNHYHHWMVRYLVVRRWKTSNAGTKFVYAKSVYYVRDENPKRRLKMPCWSTLLKNIQRTNLLQHTLRAQRMSTQTTKVWNQNQNISKRRKKKTTRAFGIFSLKNHT